MKKGGGHGGHNGLRDIIAHLGSSDFWRLRIGIDHPGDKNKVVDYVLHQPSCDEMDEIEMAMRKALKLWPLIVKGDHSAAMKELHSQPKTTETKPVQEKS
jgi:peptidyl-tRNA hydrolase, PTH1 family